MVLPIYLYGHPVLKKVGEAIDSSYPNLKDLIENMFETMQAAEGVGLAAPQIGLAIRLFIVDTTVLYKEDDPQKSRGIRQVFINPKIKEVSGDLWKYEEGCLSIPDVRGDVMRTKIIEIEYFDADFVKHTASFDGIEARVMLHEFDHINGILFVERINPLKKKLVQSKLIKISKGQYVPKYKFKPNR
jgi:peptide deformylase